MELNRFTRFSTKIEDFRKMGTTDPHKQITQNRETGCVNTWLVADFVEVTYKSIPRNTCKRHPEHRVRS